eukprot:378436_1
MSSIMADTPMSSTPGTYSTYTNDDETASSYISGSNYGASSTPYGLATPHTDYTAHHDEDDDDDVDMLEDEENNKKHIKLKTPLIKIKNLELQAIDISYPIVICLLPMRCVVFVLL